jgi:hypothetical protein
VIIEPEISNVSIVLVGNLNPRIFTPDWFARNQLLTAAEVETAEITIIHPQIAQFKTDRLEVNVEPGRFRATTTFAPHVWLLDLVIRTFGNLLVHTPIFKLGINREVHYPVASIEARNRIGHKLAPPKAWGEWGPKIEAGTGATHGGMTSLSMQQRALDDRPVGHIQATVQPSGRIKDNRGIYVLVNDNYELKNQEDVTGCEEIIELLTRNFDKSLDRSEWIVDQLMTIKDD